MAANPIVDRDCDEVTRGGALDRLDRLGDNVGDHEAGQPVSWRM